MDAEVADSGTPNSDEALVLVLGVDVDPTAIACDRVHTGGGNADAPIKPAAEVVAVAAPVVNNRVVVAGNADCGGVGRHSAATDEAE